MAERLGIRATSAAACCRTDAASGAAPGPAVRAAASFAPFAPSYVKAALPGVLLHTDDTLEWIAADVLAAPWWSVL